MTTEIATHPNPAWLQRANFLLFAELTGSGLPGRWEQLWARALDDVAFELCCVPFFVDGLALGDIVTTVPRAGRGVVVDAVRRRSGRGVLRLWLKRASVAARASVAEFLAAHAGEHEWSSDNLLAIDVPADAHASARCDALVAALSGADVEFEWAVPVSPSVRRPS